MQKKILNSKAKKINPKTKIADIGGEFELINRLTRKTKDSNIIKSIGDDCAVLKYKKNKYLLATTDTMVENDHFNTKWQTFFQIGMKLMESNVSDIVAMGGIPKYALISISIKKNTSVKFLDELYGGLHKSANKHNISIIGGDTTHGKHYVFTISLLGKVEKKLLKLRSMAKINDLICTTGNLGGSTAGLNLLKKAKKGYLKDYLEPKSRTSKEAEIIAKYANAMIDVSDGLASEVKHIAKNSKLGAKIDLEKIPITKNTIKSAKITGLDAYDFALYGGEDFELVFTISKNNIMKLRKNFKDFTIVGQMLDKKQSIYILKNNQKIKMKNGYDHFK